MSSNVLNLKRNREGYLVSDTHRQCTNPNCGKIFQITSKTVTLCKECNTRRVKCGSPKHKMHYRAKARAKLAQMEFDIAVDDIEIPEECPIMGIPLATFEGSPGGRPNSPSLDRIDSTKGYVKGNIQVISHLSNQMKSSATPKQMLKFADWVYKTYKDEPGSK